MDNQPSRPGGGYRSAFQGRTAAMRATVLKQIFVVASFLSQFVCLFALAAEPSSGRSMSAAANLMMICTFAVLTSPFAFFLMSYHYTRRFKQEYRELVIAGCTLVGIAISIYLYLNGGQWAAQLV